MLALPTAANHLSAKKNSVIAVKFQFSQGQRGSKPLMQLQLRPMAANQSMQASWGHMGVRVYPEPVPRE